MTNIQNNKSIDNMEIINSPNSVLSDILWGYNLETKEWDSYETYKPYPENVVFAPNKEECSHETRRLFLANLGEDAPDVVYETHMPHWFERIKRAGYYEEYKRAERIAYSNLLSRWMEAHIF